MNCPYIDAAHKPGVDQALVRLEDTVIGRAIRKHHHGLPGAVELMPVKVEENGGEPGGIEPRTALELGLGENQRGIRHIRWRS